MKIIILFLCFASVVIAGRVTQKSCLDKPNSGLCAAYFPMWYYDAEEQVCKKFVYGGCGGNGNRYKTEEYCLNQCKGVKKEQSEEDICSLPAEEGLCDAYIPRYYFDKITGLCKNFVYGGCGGNKNNFMKIEDCEKACDVKKDQSICSLPAETGLCDAYFPRFYFDKSTGECKRFVFGGCGGNGNNFRKFGDCQNACVCGKNQWYNACGTSCPLTCDNYNDPPEICNKMCNPGCHCKKGYVKSNDGQCVKPEDCPVKVRDLIQHSCVEEPETGVCDAHFIMWNYDVMSGTCKTFVYGGCGGNSNKYETEQECLSSCKE